MKSTANIKEDFLNSIVILKGVFKDVILFSNIICQLTVLSRIKPTDCRNTLTSCCLENQTLVDIRSY